MRTSIKTEKIPLPKIFFFDMEGTILKKEYSLDNGKVAPSAWTVLARELGNNCLLEEEESKNKWLRGEYNGYLDWMKDSVEIQVKHGLNKTIFDSVINSSEFHSGAIELLEFLQKNNVITVLITGGFKELANKVQRVLKFDHTYSACEYFFAEDGSLEYFNLQPADYMGKVSFMKEVVREHGISPLDCAFIGDGNNDKYMATEVGTSFAFNAQSELKDKCSHCIEQIKGHENLSVIIDFF